MSATMELPSDLPALPALPAGYSRWAYAGKQPGFAPLLRKPATFLDSEGQWAPVKIGKWAGNSPCHYIVALQDTEGTRHA
jgi:hypothetical protein